MMRALFLIVGLFFPLPVLAQPALLPACAESGNCGFCDIVEVVGRGFEFVLYFLGAVIFFVFMWGAFDMIAARGKSERIENGKEVMKGAFFGALFVLIAWHMINLAVYVLITSSKEPLEPKKESDERGGILFANPWNWLCEGEGLKGLPAEQKACFSRGDGTPCSTGTVNGICMEGECGTEYASTCEYLKAKYQDEFGSYGCKPVDPNKRLPIEKPPSGKIFDCLPDYTFCGLSNTTELCCGLVNEAKNPYP